LFASCVIDLEIKKEKKETLTKASVGRQTQALRQARALRLTSALQLLYFPIYTSPLVASRYALRVCAVHGQREGSVRLYAAMNLYEEAVKLALTVRRLRGAEARHGTQQQHDSNHRGG